MDFYMQGGFEAGAIAQDTNYRQRFLAVETLVGENEQAVGLCID